MVLMYDFVCAAKNIVEIIKKHIYLAHQELLIQQCPSAAYFRIPYPCTEQIDRKLCHICHCQCVIGIQHSGTPKQPE